MKNKVNKYLKNLEKINNIPSKKTNIIKNKLSIALLTSLLTLSSVHSTEYTDSGIISTWQNLETLENKQISIESINGYIKLKGVINGKFYLKNREIVPIKKQTIYINTSDKVYKINLLNPFILELIFAKKKSIFYFEIPLKLLFDRRGNILIFLGYLFKNRFFPLKNPIQYNLNPKILYVIENKNGTYIIKKINDKTIKINIQKLPGGIKNGEIILKIHK